MNTALWIIQGILAAMFTMAGIMKLTQPVGKLVKSGINWADRVPVSQVRFIGLSEFLAAVGLILPMVLNKFPFLTPIAGTGLSLLMLLAIIHHLRYKEYKSIGFNFVVLVLAVFVACGRSQFA